MPAVVLVDTSIFLNVLDVPGRNQNRTRVLDDLKSYLTDGSHLLLPFAAVVEAGNHIAQLSDGHHRRTSAQKFCEQVIRAIDGSAPWRPLQAPDVETIRGWLPEFPDCAMGEIGIGDLSIIKEWDAARTRHPHLRVLIWSLDRHLQGYDHDPTPPR